MPAEIGSPAPAFTLVDQDREPFDSESLRGHKALVVFMPFPFTGNCTAEACTLRDNLAQLGELDAKVVIVTVHPLFTNKEWATQNGIEYPVLADYWPHGETAIAYGAFNDKVGAANRVTYVLDADGVVRDIIDSGSLGVVREFDSYVAALEAI
jgi:peroxiredoxin